MRTMFIKLLFWFWLAMSLSGVLAFIFWFAPLHSEFEQRHLAERNYALAQALALYGRTAAAIFERDGKAVTLDFLDRDAPAGMRAYLFAADGTPLSGAVPSSIIYAVRQLLTRGVNEIVIDKGMVAVAVRVRSQSGKTYAAATVGAPVSPPLDTRSLLPFPLPPDIWFRFAVSFVIGGLACYCLARRLTAPICRLRSATQRLAAGELSARVPIRSSGRGDEITDLGRDFNRMADWIERLVVAQKQLVRDISHELRSPLARLNVALGLARREALPATAKELDRIEQEAERLNEMIGELLSLSLLESDNDQLKKGPIDLVELLEDVAQDADFEAMGTDRRVQFSASSPVVLGGNGILLRRALENVVRNGIRYTALGTAVEIRLEREEPSFAVIRVRDHGPGLPEEVLSHIFRPFYRVAESRDRQSGGTGIGLAITERAVVLHGGTVAARNVAGGGLEVEIRLPL